MILFVLRHKLGCVTLLSFAGHQAINREGIAMAIEIVQQNDAITDDMILTNFYYPENKQRSVWRGGDWMRHDAWCQEEAKHLRARGRDVAIVWDAGRLALFDKGSKQ